MCPSDFQESTRRSSDATSNIYQLSFAASHQKQQTGKCRRSLNATYVDGSRKAINIRTEHNVNDQICGSFRDQMAAPSFCEDCL
jgi:hypothetical protein